MEKFDVIIIGVGISGINAAHRVQTQLPGLRYAILEARDSIEGTWSFFRYPGIRSDFDLYTFGFPWKPWTGKKIIADAASIMEYVLEAVSETGIDKQEPTNPLLRFRTSLHNALTERDRYHPSAPYFKPS